MTPAPIRKLAVLVHADVADSTALVRQNEALAHQRIQSCFKGLAQMVSDYAGMTRELRGDALVAEFERASDALCAALAFQAAQNDFVDRLGDEVRPRVRIGIAMGEVISADNTLTGAGVVIAQRLEQLAVPGGVVIQGAAYETLPGYFPFEYRSLGEQKLKGFDERVRAFEVTLQPGAVIPQPDVLPVGRASLSLPDKPSIAVLPFENRSDDADQVFFSEGISEDVITALSRLPWFFVISRNSSFIYKNAGLDVRSIAQELGVQYVLDGSVRKAGNRVRITARLIDALADQHVWGEKYDRELADVFAVQDEVVESIVGAVAPEFLSAEARRARRANPDELNAWECVMRGRWHMWQLSRDHLAEARRLFERAVRLVPGGEFGASDLAFTHVLEAYYSWTESRERSLQAMTRYALQAVAVDDHDAWAHTALAFAWLFALKWEEARAAIERAVTLYPNFAPALGIKCLVLACLEDTTDAHECFARAVRLSPHDGLTPLWLMGDFWAYWVDEDYPRALQTATEFAQLSPENPTARRQLAAAFAADGRLDDARQALQSYLQLEPEHTAVNIRGRLPGRNPATVERFIEALCEAGLPRA